MIARPLAACAAAALLWGATVEHAEAQLPEHLRDYPLARVHKSGGFVAPFFDGWYDNGDGTVTYVFGFMNRNLEEVVDIPLGPDNYIEPSQYDGAQPTHFPVYDAEVSRERRTTTRSATIATDIPRGLLRERGAFAVTVPNDGTEVVWTLTHAGHTYSVPGRATSPAYEFSRGPASAGSMAPAVRFTPTGPESTRREGIMAERVTARVGTAVELSALAQDRGQREQYDTERALYPVHVAWIHHQGPGSVHFDPQVEELAGDVWSEAVTRATFTAPGEYVVRVRVDNFAAPDTRFGKQCCWSNAFVPVTVTP